MTPEDLTAGRLVLETPMLDNEAGAATIHEYLRKLMMTLWSEKECFSGKRPFGNSGWEYALYRTLIVGRLVDGQLDENGYVTGLVVHEADALIGLAVQAVFELSKPT